MSRRLICSSGSSSNGINIFIDLAKLSVFHAPFCVGSYYQPLARCSLIDSFAKEQLSPRYLAQQFLWSPLPMHRINVIASVVHFQWKHFVLSSDSFWIYGENNILILIYVVCIRCKYQRVRLGCAESHKMLRLRISLPETCFCMIRKKTANSRRGKKPKQRRMSNAAASISDGWGFCVREFVDASVSSCPNMIALKYLCPKQRTAFISLDRPDAHTHARTRTLVNRKTFCLHNHASASLQLRRS